MAWDMLRAQPLLRESVSNLAGLMGLQLGGRARAGLDGSRFQSSPWKILEVASANGNSNNKFAALGY